MSRMPIRVRLSLAFALAMAVVLAATGAFVYFRFESALDESVDESLSARLSDAVSLARAGGSTGITISDEGFTEIAEWFETLARAERSHAGRFQKGLDSLK